MSSLSLLHILLHVDMSNNYCLTPTASSPDNWRPGTPCQPASVRVLLWKATWYVALLPCCCKTILNNACAPCPWDKTSNCKCCCITPHCLPIAASEGGGCGRGMAGLRMEEGFLYVSRWCRISSLGPGGMRASLRALQQQ